MKSDDLVDDQEFNIDGLVEENDGSVEEKRKRGRPPKKSEDSQLTPCIGSEKWTAHVLSKLRPDELDDLGFPKTHGLRRAVELFIGPIVGNVASIKQTGTADNGMISSVEYTLHIRWDVDDGGIRTFADVADASPHNTAEEFNKYPTAVACTRAEGRCLRKALQLSNIVASEEAKEHEESGISDPNAQITSTQINVIDSLSRSNDIHVLKLINAGKEKFNKIEDLSRGLAARILVKLNEWRRDKSKIPAGIKGYQVNWRTK